MPTQPNRLQPDTSPADNLALINDNFDKAVSDIADLGAKFSSVGTASFTLAAGNSVSANIHVSDSHSNYIPGSIQIVPRVDIRVDTDDADHDLDYGGSLDSGQRNTEVGIRVHRTVQGSDAAMYIVWVHNWDTNSHTYYLSTDESYLSSPTTGQFR